MKVGIDIIEVERVKEDELFLNKLFTENEIKYINKFANKKERIAGFFCAKEAILKALDYPNMNVKEVEISHSKSGRPTVRFSGEAELFYLKNFSDIDISISHSKTIATAICIVKQRPSIIKL